MKKFISFICLFVLLVGCQAQGEAISVLSRESGSGTRGAFVSLTGVEEDGSDNTVETAEITNSTAVMIESVKSSKEAIGYISLGVLNDEVKALKIDDVEANIENIQSGSYPLQRPFELGIQGSLEEQKPEVKEFIAFILSEEGQEIVLEEGYVPVEENQSYQGNISGKLVIAGSSSVSPLMKELIAKYESINPALEIELQESDSTAGIQALQEGVVDLAMASRELKDSELDSGIEAITMAKDGIAVIVDLENPVDNLTMEQVKDIYTGTISSWEEVQ